MLKLVSAIDASYKSVLDYYNEFSNINDINNYAITLIKEGYGRYINYLLFSDKANNVYFLIDTDNPAYLIGYCSFEDSHVLDFHEEFLNDGAVGYGIRPNQRNKGYGKKILNLMLYECVRHGLNEICVSCHEITKVLES